MHQGRVFVDNTEARKRELGEFIDKIVSTRKLSSADALKLRGRMQFTAGQLFGRVAKTCLARVTNHAYQSSSSDVAESLVSSLTLFKRFLLAQKPRVVTTAMLQTWVVFTDASFEHDSEDIDTAVALELWGKLLSSRQVVFYVDNDGVRDVLISCNTAHPVGSVLLTSVLELEGALAISSWFTRVPSKSNIADSPSRGEIADLIALKAKHEQVEPLKILSTLGPVA